MMENIEKIKRTGAAVALRDAIKKLQSEISDRAWAGTEDSYVFTRLGQAIDNVDLKLVRMRRLLQALQEIEPKNK